MEYTENNWINCMEGFAGFIQTVPPQSARPVKIAVLDSGFDDSPDICDDRFAWITSWYRKNSTGMLNMYFSRHSGKRWTRMSALISQICPRSRLYVGLLEESPDVNGNSGRLWATLESVIEAIIWAVECGVDIISIPCGVNGDLDDWSLHAAISLATRRGILVCWSGETPILFRDGGTGLVCKSTGRSGLYPREHPRGYFLFPKGDIAFVDSDEVNVSYESGDAMATAVASGLAGQVVYCAGLAGKTYDWLESEDMFERKVKLPDIGDFLNRNLEKLLLLYLKGKRREADLGNGLLEDFLYCCGLHG
ncbi:hypothetical protein ANO14919_056390 [Xylariales sp. No.14919]|nr:hypothetical protein ANO14919_056390 [Xylariales sp. No.14919]